MVRILWAIEGGGGVFELELQRHGGYACSYNRPFLCHCYWTGISLWQRLMLLVFSNTNEINLFFNDVSPHDPALQASSNPILRIQTENNTLLESQRHGGFQHDTRQKSINCSKVMHSNSFTEENPFPLELHFSFHAFSIEQSQLTV